MHKKMSGLRIVKKEKIFYEINFKSTFSKDDKDVIKHYIREIMQTDYKDKCINVFIESNNLISFVGSNNNKICQLYLSEIRF